MNSERTTFFYHSLSGEKLKKMENRELQNSQIRDLTTRHFKGRLTSEKRSERETKPRKNLTFKEAKWRRKKEKPKDTVSKRGDVI